MRFISFKSVRYVGAAALALAAGAAQAHTGHGTSGVAEGLAHPLGADHLLAMLAVGLWSVSALPANKAWWGPATFMAALMVSAGLGAMGISLPFLEHIISVSVVLFGAMLVMARVKMPVGAGLALVAMAASLHGLAHGAETPNTGFAGYAVGFLLTTAALHAAGVVAGLGIRRYMASQTNWIMAALGTLLGGAGVVLFSQL